MKKEQMDLTKYHFKTEEESKKAQEDLEYIRRFMQVVDIKQPKMARQLYEKIKNSNSLMTSVVGEAFKDKLVQIFVEDEVRKKKQELEACTSAEQVIENETKFENTEQPKAVEPKPDSQKQTKDKMISNLLEFVSPARLRNEIWSCIIISLVYLAFTALFVSQTPIIKKAQIVRAYMSIWTTFTYFWPYVLAFFIFVIAIRACLLFKDMIVKKEQRETEILKIIAQGTIIVIVLFLIGSLRKNCNDSIISYQTLMKAIRQNQDYTAIYQDIRAIIFKS